MTAVKKSKIQKEKNNEISKTQKPKNTVKVKIDNNEVIEIRSGMKVCEVAEYLGSGLYLQAAAGLINNKIVDLSFPITKDCGLKIVTLDTLLGMKVYRRSVEYVLEIAVKELYGSKARLLVGPHIEKGYYFDLIRENGEYNDTVSLKDIEDIRAKMHEIIARNLKFEVKKITKTQAKKIFAKRPEVLELLDVISSNEIKIYYQKDTGFADFHHGPIFPNTGYIKAFDLLISAPGFILQFPDYVNKVLIMPKQPKQLKLTQVLKDTREWYKIQGVENVGELNRILKSKSETSELIKIAEAFQEKKVAEIADMIVSKKDAIKFITIAGPSSSGKTTFAKRLSIQLKVNGIFPIALSLDDYFVERELTPRDENGNYDFEVIDALDLKLINEHLAALLKNKPIDVPRFDFTTGHRKKETHRMELKPGQVVILEGIHGLNDRLTATVPSENKFKIYISALNQLRIDDINRIPTTDCRLIRRMVRDSKFRSYSAQETIARWPSVRRGEERHIFPFQENADIIFNSALIYELAVLKKYALPILEEVPKNSPEFPIAESLISFLMLFRDCPENEIPPTSIMREFIGGSSFDY
ncbi:MAG TPA: nucleoside kinase [bacterium]|nr:nucleoside kinase [bacterium]